MKIDLRVGDVWETKDGHFRRRVFHVSDCGVATKIEKSGEKYYWNNDDINDDAFHKLVSRLPQFDDQIHAHMHCTPPGLTPQGNFRCIIKEWKYVCMVCGQKFWTLDPLLGNPVCGVCAHKEVERSKVTVNIDLNPPGPGANCRCTPEKLSKIDTVKVGQVWKGVDDGDRRRIVGTSSSEKGIVAITTINLEFSKLQQKEVRWTRAEAERLVLGRLIQDVKVVPTPSKIDTVDVWQVWAAPNGVKREVINVDLLDARVISIRTKVVGKQAAGELMYQTWTREEAERLVLGELVMEDIPSIGDRHPTNYRFRYAVCQVCGAELGYLPPDIACICSQCAKAKDAQKPEPKVEAGQVYWDMLREEYFKIEERHKGTMCTIVWRDGLKRIVSAEHVRERGHLILRCAACDLWSSCNGWDCPKDRIWEKG